MGEPWIRVHAQLLQKPVIGRAAAALGVSRHEAIGLLVTFWGAVSQLATNGRVGHYEDEQLETWAMWTRKRGKFAAFLREHHLDPDGRVNEWDEYAGPLETRREKDRNRKRTSRTLSAGGHADVTRTSRGQGADGPQEVTRTSALTRANETKRDETKIVVDTPAVESALIGEPALTAIYVAIWANGAIAERWGEQPNTLTHGSAVELAAALQELNVEWRVVRDSIYRQCRALQRPAPPNSVNYFRPGILADWDAEVTRRAAVASGEQPPARAAPAGPLANDVAAVLSRWKSDTDAKEQRHEKAG